jgi:replicative DNA helicase
VSYDRDAVLAATDLGALLEEVTGQPPHDGRYACPNRSHSQTGKTPPVGVDGDLWHCHNGGTCGVGGTAVDVLVHGYGMDAGEALAELARKAGLSSNGSEPERRIVDVYPYTDEHGELLFEVVRFEPKDFRQRRPDDRGGRIWGTKGVRRVPYRLPQVLEAVKAGRTVYACEGEKDVHALEAVGEVATCNPMGAGKWRSEHSEALKGATEVVVVADRDEEGRKHARQVVEAITPVVGRVLRVEPKVGKDVAEHLGAGLSVDELETEVADEQSADKPAPVRLKSGATFVLDDPVDLEPIWGVGEEVLWSSGEPLWIVGPTGTGKTTVAVQMVAGRLGIISELLGLPITAIDRPLLYLAMDRPRQIRRAMRRAFDEHHRQLLDELLIVREGPLPLDIGRAPEVLVELAQSVGAGAVILDSAKDAAVKIIDDEVGGNVNRALQFLVAAEIDAAVLHHQRKGQGGAKPTTLEDVYGSTWLTAGAGSVVLLWGAAGDPLVELSHLKQPASEVGPLTLEHDHLLGRTTVYRGAADPMVALRNSSSGLTPVEYARLLFERVEPTDNQRKKAQRQLDRLVRDGLAHRDDGGRSQTGQKTPARYYQVDDRKEER